MLPEIIYDIALTLQPKIGPRTAAHLLSIFSSAERIFNSTQEELVSRAELNPLVAIALLKREYFKQAEKEVIYCQKHGITPIVSTSDAYPPLLRECNDYPHVLYYKGDPGILSNRMLSVVGTRKITSYGHKVCDRLIGEMAKLAPSTVIVSGLAYGVDAASHRAALNYGLKTIAVLPCALPDVYPSNHQSLGEEILRKGGGLLTEYHSNSKNNGNNFIPRNRIIAGMSEGTLLVESPLKGGSLVTANMADGYNRCVMAVPGRVGDMCSEGTNQMIREQKARMVCSAKDILRELMWDLDEAPSPPPADRSILSPTARNILETIPEGESISIDHLADLSKLSIAELSAIIFELECEGAVRMLPGKRYEKL